MRLVYMDEAGTSHPDEEPHVVVSAVIVHADDQLMPAERGLYGIATKHIPAKHLTGFVFHAHELFQGRGRVFGDREEWPSDRRLAIADDLSTLVGALELPITFGYIKRSEMAGWNLNRHKETIAANVLAFMHCALRINRWLGENTQDNELGMLIIENNDSARRLIRKMHRYLQDPSRHPKEHWPYLPIIKIKHDPLFEDKTRPDSCFFEVCPSVPQIRVTGSIAPPAWLDSR